LSRFPHGHFFDTNYCKTFFTSSPFHVRSPLFLPFSFSNMMGLLFNLVYGNKYCKLCMSTCIVAVRCTANLHPIQLSCT
jgi:hypothetical protein